jgi:DNA primase
MMTHYITTKSGHCFAFATSEQANRFLEKVKGMSYSEVAKLHREIYGATLPKNAPVGKVR